MQEWMEAKNLQESDLEEINDINEAFWHWFENERIAKPGSFFDPKNFQSLKPE